MFIREIFRFTVLFIILINLASASSVIISEIELNPAGTDNKNEWIELYSSQEVSLEGWTIVNVKGKIFSLNGSFSGYKIMITPYSFLTNSDQKIKLFDSENQLIDETIEISDSYNDERSWQYCGEWKFEQASREEKNECDLEEEVIEEKEVVEEKVIGSSFEEGNVKDNNVIESNVIKNIVENEINEVEVITLKIEQKDIKTWKSKKQYIKEYALVGFALFCLLILVYLVKYGQDKSDNDF
ncbi:MAG: lamin tail domain-containing protein [Nanoarchaeota archaeon]